MNNHEPHLSQEQKDILMQDTNNNGIPDFFDNPAETVGNMTQQNGMPLTQTQQKMMTGLFGLFGSRPGAHVMKQLMKKIPTGPADTASGATPQIAGQKQRASQYQSSIEEEQRRERTRAALVIGIIVLFSVFYFVFKG